VAPQLIIDGLAIEARSEQTLLQAARGAGIAIPTLCHLETACGAGVCRMCLVEVEGASKLVPACITPVRPGMVVATRTPRIDSIRRTLVELLLSERSHVCAVCVASGGCELQDAAAALGVSHSPFPRSTTAHRVDLSHPQFGLDPNRCILCTRCIRVCDQHEGAHTWDLRSRNIASLLVSDLDRPWGAAESCTSCGRCAAACPTGAIFVQGSGVGAKAWHG
jgi:bidirectional [NiFe] hydrogenase diaphorase subunit